MHSPVKIFSSPITLPLLIDEKITSKSLTVVQVQEVSRKQQLCLLFAQLPSSFPPCKPGYPPTHALQQLLAADLTATLPRGTLGRGDRVRVLGQRALPTRHPRTPPPPSPSQQKQHPCPPSSPAGTCQGDFFVGVGERKATSKAGDAK